MNRRGFLELMGGMAAGMMLDPERLLWTPGAKKIFVPPPPVKYREVAQWTCVVEEYGDHLMVTALQIPSLYVKDADLNPEVRRRVQFICPPGKGWVVWNS